jgi:hypothetical protein
MPIPKIPVLIRLAPAVALLSCAAPKAIVVEPPPAPKTEKPPEPVVPEVDLSSLPDDGIRLPDMLGLPGEGEFRPTSPGLPSLSPGAGAVISRPPTDPPSRPKPEEAAPEPKDPQ